MKFLFSTVFLALFIFIPAFAKAENLAEKPRAVVFMADWCASCKILDPNMKKAMDESESAKGLEVIVFNLTDETTKAESEKLATEKGLLDLYKAQNGKTGFFFLLDTKSNEPVLKITKESSVDEIKKAFDYIVAKTS